MIYQLVTLISTALIPAIIVLVPLYGLYKKVAVYESFVEGAKEGFPTVITIIPPLVGMIVAVSIFRESGALSFYLSMIEPLMKYLHIPMEVLPVGLLRPITGTGSLALVENIIRTYGADSFVAKVASTIQGSSDTTLYILTVYFGSVGVKKSLYSLKVGLLADLIGFVASIFVCYLIFT